MTTDKLALALAALALGIIVGVFAQSQRQSRTVTVIEVGGLGWVERNADSELRYCFVGDIDADFAVKSDKQTQIVCSGWETR